MKSQRFDPSLPLEFYVNINDLCSFFGVDPDEVGVYGSWDVRVHRNYTNGWSVDPMDPHAEMLDEFWAPENDYAAGELLTMYGQKAASKEAGTRRTAGRDSWSFTFSVPASLTKMIDENDFYTVVAQLGRKAGKRIYGDNVPDWYGGKLLKYSLLFNSASRPEAERFLGKFKTEMLQWLRANWKQELGERSVKIEDLRKDSEVYGKTKARRTAATEEEIDVALRKRLLQTLAKVKQCYVDAPHKWMTNALVLSEKALKKQTSDQETIDALREIHDRYVNQKGYDVEPLIDLADAVGYLLDGSGAANKSVAEWAKIVITLAEAAEDSATTVLSEKKKKTGVATMLSRTSRSSAARKASIRRALMERNVTAPPAARMPGKRFRSVDPVELEYDEQDPMEHLELEPGMEPERMLRRLPPRAPALPARKIRMRRLSALQRRRLARSRYALDGTQEVLPETYEAVIDNTSSGRGKFEGEGSIGEWVYDQSLEGWGEMLGDVETFGHYTLLTFEKPVLVREPDGSEWTFSAVIIYEESQGFVDPTYYDTAKEAETAWAGLAEEYSMFIDEVEGENEGGIEDEQEGEFVTVEQKGDMWKAYYGLHHDVVAASEDEEEFWTMIREWMEREGYWPNIYSVNDHGNVTQYDTHGNSVH